MAAPGHSHSSIENIILDESIQGIKEKIPNEERFAKESRNIKLNARPAPVSYRKTKKKKKHGRVTMKRTLDELDAIADEQCIVDNQQKDLAYQ